MTEEPKLDRDLLTVEDITPWCGLFDLQPGETIDAFLRRKLAGGGKLIVVDSVSKVFVVSDADSRIDWVHVLNGVRALKARGGFFAKPKRIGPSKPRPRRVVKSKSARYQGDIFGGGDG